MTEKKQNKKKIAVLQSNYLPWRGYFDIINDVDVFIFYDEVQYTKNDWRNRNKVYSKQGLSWLTLPCGYNINQSIDKVTLKNDIDWSKKHWNIIYNAYSCAPYFDLYADFFENTLINRKWVYLSELNQFLILNIARLFFGITTEFANSRDYISEGTGSDKLLSLLKAVGCSVYVSGPSAKAYLDEKSFTNEGIEVIWKDYSGYPEYKQMNVPFEPNVSVIDLLMNVGKAAPKYIWG